jgi:hypothetical protein
MTLSGALRQWPIRIWVCVIAACAVSPFVFVLAQGCMALLIVPTMRVFGATSTDRLGVVTALAGVLGSLLAAAALCLPLGWMARKRPLPLGIIVGLVGCMAVTWVWLEAALGLRVLELVAFLGGCALFSVAGARGACRVAA